MTPLQGNASTGVDVDANRTHQRRRAGVIDQSGVRCQCPLGGNHGYLLGFRMEDP